MTGLDGIILIVAWAAASAGGFHSISPLTAVRRISMAMYIFLIISPLP
jgi:ABC-type transport system involved in cytochrome c biogenesis permease subunit